MKVLYTILICLASYGMLKSQDVHFTYFQLAPLTLNPALAGNFYGSVRVGGIYRGQWLGTNGFSTPTFYVDAPIMKGFRKQDWVGVGINMTNALIAKESAGDIGFGINSQYLNVAYHFSLDKKQTSIFSIGVQYGSYSLNATNFASSDGILKSNILANTPLDVIAMSRQLDFSLDPTNPELSASSSDINVGLHYRGQLNKRNSIKLGANFAHIGTPDVSLLQIARNPQDTTQVVPQQNINSVALRMTGYGQYTSYINEKLRFSPAIYFQSTKGFVELGAQAMFGYLLDPKKGTTVNAGLGYRGGDAGEVLIGMEQGPLTAGVSFDFTTSGFQKGAGLQNGFELAVSYIFKIYKSPEVEPVICCPRF